MCVLVGEFVQCLYVCVCMNVRLRACLLLFYLMIPYCKQLIFSHCKFFMENKLR